MARLRPLDPPHKGIRNALGQLSLATDSLDPTCPAAVARLRALVADVATILRDHAHQEDRYIFAPAEQVRPGLTRAYEAAHVRLEHALDEVVAAAEALVQPGGPEALAALGVAVHRFHGDYLDHMLEEEAEIEPVLLAHFTDEELMGHQGEIMREMPFATLLLWFRFIVPARSTADNRQVLGGFKSAAPAAAVAAAWEVLRDALPADRFEAITADL